jgi:glucose-6-phosphate 1-dehydrogenase
MLIIVLQPIETISMALLAKTRGIYRQGIRLRELQLDLGRADAFADHRRRIAYERLLLDLIEGNPTLFVRRDEVEAQWQWIDGIRAAWAKAGIKPAPYAAGTRGPSAATDFAKRHGFTWHN